MNEEKSADDIVMSCMTCGHSRNVRLAPDAINTTLVCTEGPCVPIVVIDRATGGFGTMWAPPQCPPRYLCSRYKPMDTTH